MGPPYIEACILESKFKSDSVSKNPNSKVTTKWLQIEMSIKHMPINCTVNSFEPMDHSFKTKHNSSGKLNTE